MIAFLKPYQDREDWDVTIIAIKAGFQSPGNIQKINSIRFNSNIQLLFIQRGLRLNFGQSFSRSQNEWIKNKWESGKDLQNYLWVDGFKVPGLKSNIIKQNSNEISF